MDARTDVPAPANEPIHEYAPHSAERIRLSAALRDLSANPIDLPHVIAGRMTIGKALGVIGARIQGDIQQRISSNVPPPNAPSTIAAKARGSGSATTLINYGQLRGTVHFAVVNAH